MSAAEWRKYIFVRRFCFLIILSLVFENADSQVFDSIKSSFRCAPTLIGGFTSRNTFINGFLSPVSTARIGLKFGHQVRVGVGFNWQSLPPYNPNRENRPFYLDKHVSGSTGEYLVHPTLSFSYVSVYFEYVYFRNRKWEFSVPLQIGVGDSWYYYSANGISTIENKHIIALYEPTVSCEYKICRWLGVGLDVGLRLMVINNKHIGNFFNSPMYNFGGIIYWGEVYRMVFPLKNKR